mgnify:CR=1 FL=1
MTEIVKSVKEVEVVTHQSEFKLCSGHMKGFHMTFANGVVVSVQWGRGSYSDNRDDETATRSTNAEIAVWDADGKWILRQLYAKNTGETLHDDVNGWLSTTDVLQVMNWAAAWRGV